MAAVYVFYIYVYKRARAYAYIIIVRAVWLFSNQSVHTRWFFDSPTVRIYTYIYTIIIMPRWIRVKFEISAINIRTRVRARVCVYTYL